MKMTTLSGGGRRKRHRKETENESWMQFYPSAANKYHGNTPLEKEKYQPILGFYVRFRGCKSMKRLIQKLFFLMIQIDSRILSVCIFTSKVTIHQDSRCLSVTKKGSVQTNLPTPMDQHISDVFFSTPNG